MTPNQKQAVDAIKAATGWDAGPEGANGGIVVATRPNGTRLVLWRSEAGKWKAAVDALNALSWQGKGPTPEAAINDVLPRYRVHIAALAADILPGWPRLEWTGQPYARTLCFVVGGFTDRILTVYPERSVWTVSIDNVTGPQRTREAVLAAVVAHVESLALPCPLPPFPETPDAS